MQPRARGIRSREIKHACAARSHLVEYLGQAVTREPPVGSVGKHQVCFLDRSLGIGYRVLATVSKAASRSLTPAALSEFWSHRSRGAPGVRRQSFPESREPTRRSAPKHYPARTGNTLSTTLRGTSGSRE